jgi:hypothetical protein
VYLRLEALHQRGNSFLIILGRQALPTQLLDSKIYHEDHNLEVGKVRH